MIPEPTPAEIAAAMDVLDWTDLPTILRLREKVSELIRQVERGSIDRPLRSSEAIEPVFWARIEIAILYVLFRSSDDVLERALRREPAIH